MVLLLLLTMQQERSSSKLFMYLPAPPVSFVCRVN